MTQRGRGRRVRETQTFSRDREISALELFFTKLAWEESARYGPAGCVGKAGERGCKLLQKIRDLEEELENEQNEKNRIEQLECQLAGCMTAATGWAKDPPHKGDWGWSPAFQDVLDLRTRYENQRKVLESGLALVESSFAHVSHGGPTRAEAEQWLKEARNVFGVELLARTRKG